MNALLTAIALWLSANFGLPATHDLRRVEHMSAQCELVHIDRLADGGPSVAKFKAGNAACAPACDLSLRPIDPRLRRAQPARYAEG